MKKHYIRILFILILIITIISIPTFGLNIIDESTYTKQITPEISYFEKTQLINNKWIIIKGITMSLEEDAVNLVSLYNKTNVRKSLPLSELASQEENIIGAINGDFFDPVTQSVLGPIIDQGKIIQNGVRNPKFNEFGLTKNKTPFIADWDQSFMSLKIHGKTIPIDYVNKNYAHLGHIVFLNSNFGEKSIGNTTDKKLYEALIRNDKVEKIAYDKAPMNIPEDGYILSFPEKHKNILEGVSVGDTIKLKTSNALDMIQANIGGGAILVDQGEVPSSFSLDIKGNHPRSAIGYTEDQKKLILITVEGRKKFVPGVNQNELAEIMIDLGAYKALNLDGGGSSELLLRKFGSNTLEVKNYLSDRGERRIYNGLGIIETYEESEISDISITLDKSHSIVNEPIGYEIYASDKNYNPKTLDPNKIQMSSSLKGTFKDNKFYPLEAGSGTIKITYDHISYTQDIVIHDDFAELRITPKTITAKTNESIELSPVLLTKSGYEIPISLERLDLSLTDSLYKIDHNTITFLDSITNQKINFSYKDLSTQISVNQNIFETIIIDEFEKNNGKYLGYPEDLQGKYDITRINYDGNFSGRLFYDFTDYKEQTRASYFQYDTPIVLEEPVNSIGLQVFGYFGKNHWLRLKVKDASDEVHNLTLTRNVNWKDWKYVETKIPENLSFPLTIERIYVVETDYSNSNKGLLLFDNLQVEKKKDITLEQKTQYESIFASSVDSKYIWDSLFITNQTSLPYSKNYKIMTHNEELLKEEPDHTINLNQNYTKQIENNKVLLSLDNSNGTLLNYDGEQWKFLKDTLSNSDHQNLIIYLKEPFNFKNQLELNLLTRHIKSHQTRNNSNVFIIAKTDHFSLEYFEDIPILNINPSEEFTLRFNFFKTLAKYELHTP